MIKERWEELRCALVVILTLVTIALAQPVEAWRQTPRGSAASNDWLLWGGPRRDFITAAAGLASAWPSEGPRKLWGRPLGEGDLPIAVEGAGLFTAFPSGPPDGIRS